MLNKVPLGTSSNDMRCTFAYAKGLGWGECGLHPAGDPVPKKKGKKDMESGVESV